MHHHQHAHHALKHARRAVLHDNETPESIVLSLPIPNKALNEPPSRVLAPRSTDTCADGNNSGTCQKPTNVSSLPIILGAALPITAALIILLILHRRHKRKLRLEDMDEKHKSLDFGMGEGGKKNSKKGGLPKDPEMSTRRGRGLSMDGDLNSPYLLPAALQQSRESFHSLSRSVRDGGDPYRPVTMIKGDDAYSRMRGDNSSIYTGSSGATRRTEAPLIRQHSPYPPRGESRMRDESASPQDQTMPQIKFPEPTLQRDSAKTPPPPPPPSQPPVDASNNSLMPGQSETLRDSYFDRNAQDMRNSNNYLTNMIASGDAMAQTNQETKASQSSSPPPAHSQAKVPEVTLNSSSSPPRPNGLPSNPRPPRLQSMEAQVQHHPTQSMISDASDYGDGFKVTPPSEPRTSDIIQPKPMRSSLQAPMPVAQEEEHHGQREPVGLGVDNLGYDPRRLSMSIRPLPVEDPTDNPEQRANRIRSFYKEYFDDSRPDPVGHFPQDHGDLYGGEYLDGAVFDPDTGRFVVARPFAEPVTRRAMTPPPRAPPKFRGGPGSHAHSSSGSSQWMMPPRGVSAMSARPAPRKNLPPPKALTSLPTPHLLKDDNAIFGAIDFAPPTSFRDRQAGRRPDSPLGTARPYSPSVRAHIPLDSPFQELSPMPSPHLLRKSGTFTALDFAPPPRFRGSDTASDAGSIRSNRSAMSNVHMHNIRNGAYRVSRIGNDVVGTRDDIATSLKPKLNMVSPA